MCFLWRNRKVRILIGMFIGAAAGFAIGYFGKCASGTCPLTSNPVISALIGAMFGALLAAGL
ncbi:MAG: hypothetical protein ISS70_14475 [Phycisphaerae bacterium]|nr:hypothetical protein [Phycisphaerae bacterium]